MANDEHEELAVNHRSIAQANSRSSISRTWSATSVRHTTLRTKTLLIVLTTLLGLIVVLFLPVRFLLLDSYLSIEQQDVRNNTERALNALADEIAALSRTTGDYAAWDDTYEFMQSGDPAYIDTNYLDETFQRNRLSLVLIVDSDKRLVFGKAFDLHSNMTVAVPEQLRQLSIPGTLLHHSATDGMASGVMNLPGGPMLLASRPILTSAYTGPIRGTLIMGRQLDADETAQLAATTRLTLSFFQFGDPRAPADVQSSHVPLLSDTTAHVQPIDERTIAGYAMLPDIFGAPGLIARIEMPRNIYSQGKATTLYFFLSLLASGLVFGLVIVVLIERAVLSRLTRLGANVQQISSNGDLAARVDVVGSDEVSTLAETINCMLGTIEQAQAERRQAEEARAQMQEEVVRAREQLTQMIIHDLKTPLTAVVGFLDILRRGQLSDGQQEMVRGAHRSATRMDRLVATILDTARLAEGRMTLRREPTDVAELAQYCVDDLRLWAEQDMHQLVVELPDDLPALMLDAGLLQRVILNLISNAIKHTPIGTRITLGARSDDAELRLWVSDNGPGIPLEQQRRLFERFCVNESQPSRQNSTGLGLTFCKLAIEAHGGAITLESSATHGTTFTIVLPLDLANAPYTLEHNSALADGD